MKPVKYQMKNGLTVLLAESRKSPVISVQMWVRTGSADESAREAGISHFIEHLVFKGTRKYGVGEIAATVEGAGGELNAYTSFDQTVFHVTIASAQAETALEVISEMMGHPRFDPEEVDREREVVIEEIKRGNDSPGRRNSQLLFGTAYKKHPYGRPVIGFDKVVNTVSVSVLKRYFRERYCPRNMFLLVSGDFGRSEMKAKIQQHYGDFADENVRKVKRAKEPAKAATTKVENSPFKETHINLAWRIPSVTHKDVPALDALALILGQGDSSRLTHRLRIEDAIVNAIGSSAFTPMDDGLFTVSMTLDRKNAANALSETAVVMKNFLEDGPHAEELAKAVVGLASDTIYSLETVDGLARSFGSMEFSFKDPSAYEKYLKTLSSLKPEDLLKIARKYLKPENLMATSLTDGDPAAFKKLFAKFKKDYRPEKLKTIRPVKMQRPVRLKASGAKSSKDQPVQRVKLPGGGVFFLKHQPETPTVSLRIALGGGLSLEPNGKEGLNELFARTWACGGARFNEQTIHREVDATASGFSTFSGRNTVGMNADYISGFDARIWDFVEDCLIAPSLPAEAFERERGLLLQQTQLKKDHPSSVCMRAFNEELFKNHPYAKDPGGTETSLPGLKASDLAPLAQGMMLQGNFAASIVGDFDPDLWTKRLAQLTGSWAKGHSMLKEFVHEGPKKDVRIFNKLEKEQTHLIVGMKGLGLRDSRRWALEVLQAIMAGQGGRLFIELRDKKSLAYSVSPIQMEGLGTGTFGAYIACSPEKAALAEKMIRQEFVKLAESLASEEELRRARTYLSGRTAIDLQKKSTIASTVLFDEIYGNKSEETLHPDKFYAAVTAEEVRSLAADLFSRPTILSAVGPRSW